MLQKGYFVNFNIKDAETAVALGCITTYLLVGKKPTWYYSQLISESIKILKIKASAKYLTLAR